MFTSQERVRETCTVEQVVRPRCTDTRCLNILQVLKASIDLFLQEIYAVLVVFSDVVHALDICSH